MAQTKENVKRSGAFWKIKSIIEACDTFEQVKGAQTLVLRFTGASKERARLYEIANEKADALNPYIAKESPAEQHETDLHRASMNIR